MQNFDSTVDKNVSSAIDCKIQLKKTTTVSLLNLK